MQEDNSPEFVAEALEVRDLVDKALPWSLRATCEIEIGLSVDFWSVFQENIFEWQFVICGPVDTEFEVSNWLYLWFILRNVWVSMHFRG